MFAYVTPTVRVTLSDFGCSWEPRSNPQVHVFFIPGMDESEERHQTSCLVYLEERDKCGFHLFQGTHINHAWEVVQGVGKGMGGWVASVCRERTAFTHFENCENVPFTPSAARPSSGAALLVQKCLRRASSVIQRCWTDKSTMCKLVSYSDS